MKNKCINFFSRFLMILLIVYVPGGPDVFAGELEKYEAVSIINLIATPEEYYQKKIAVGGYIRFRFEDRSLCLMEIPTSMKDCIWIEIDKIYLDDQGEEVKGSDSRSEWESYEGHLGTIYGRFDMFNKGHFDGRSGAIYNIKKVIVTKRKYREM